MLSLFANSCITIVLFISKEIVFQAAITIKAKITRDEEWPIHLTYPLTHLGSHCNGMITREINQDHLYPEIAG